MFKLRPLRTTSDPNEPFNGEVHFPKDILYFNQETDNKESILIWASLSKSAKSILPVLLWSAGANRYDVGTTIISQSQLCNRSGIRSRNTVKKGCDELCRKGIIAENRKYSVTGFDRLHYKIQPRVLLLANEKYEPFPCYHIINGNWARLGKVPAAQALYWGIRSLYSEGGIVSARRKELCKRSGISDSTLDRALHTLVGEGFVEIE